MGCKGISARFCFQLNYAGSGAVTSGVWIGKLSLLPLNSLSKWDSPGLSQAGTFIPKSSLKFVLFLKYSLKVLPARHSSSRLLLVFREKEQCEDL